MLALCLLLAASPLDTARARLDKELKSELARHFMQLETGGPNELVLRLFEDTFERLDPLWKGLYAIEQAARLPGAPTFRVELVPHPEQRVCLQRRELTRGYLFKKQRGDPTRITVWGHCGADQPDEPAKQALGPITLEARSGLTATNSSDAGVELTIVGVDLISEGKPLHVRALPFEPLTVTVPANGTLEVSLPIQSAHLKPTPIQRRARFTVKGQAGTGSVLGPAGELSGQ